MPLADNALLLCGAVVRVHSMTERLATPQEIRRLGVHALRIVWDDGHASEYRNDFLRARCPCAECRQRPPRTLPVVNERRDEIYPVQIGVVGRYALSLQWSDGHDTGIYSYQTLRGLCRCAQCDSASPADAAP
jgi:DUF971 family protein